MGILDGKKGLIIGIANNRSIAWACAKAMDAAGATLGATWHTEKSRPHVEPLLDALGADIRRPLDVFEDAQMQALFDAVAERWGYLDFILHAVAYAPGRICRVASPTARAKASARPWTRPAIPSSAWRGWPSR